MVERVSSGPGDPEVGGSGCGGGVDCDEWDEVLSYISSWVVGLMEDAV